LVSSWVNAAIQPTALSLDTWTQNSSASTWNTGADLGWGDDIEDWGPARQARQTQRAPVLARTIHERAREIDGGICLAL